MRREVVVGVLCRGGVATDVDRGARDCSDRHRCDLAHHGQRVHGLAVRAVADQRQVDVRDGAVTADLGVGDRAHHLAGSQGTALERRDAGLHTVRRDVASLDDDHGRALLVRERLLDVVVDLEHREGLAGDVVRSGLLGVHAQGGQREHHEDADAGDEGHQRAAHDVAEDEAPHARVALLALEAAQQRQTALVDAIAELREHCGQHRQRAQHGDADDEDGPDRHRAALGLAEEEDAGQRGHHGEARDQHGVTAGGGGSLERRQLACSPRPLLALALEVEERVVDCDGHADQHHQDLRALARRHELARDGGQPERGEDRGQPEQHGDAGREQGAEGQQQDQKGDRDRQELRLLEVLRELVVEVLARGRVAELLDA